jgi:hypothetical protein
MKKIIIFIATVFLAKDLIAQSSSELFKKDFDEVSFTYIHNLQPYFYKLSEAQCEPLEDNASPVAVYDRKSLVQAKVAHFNQVAQFFSSDGYALLSKERGASYTQADKKIIIDFFDHWLPMEFLGLDYQFLKKTKEEILVKK